MEILVSYRRTCSSRKIESKNILVSRDKGAIFYFRLCYSVKEENI